MHLSRRTWLWTSTAALASACTRPGPTKLPEAGAEGPRALTRRGAENLIALTELGAAIRWLHPSDGVALADWESLLLDGVRTLEGARTRPELVEGLRGLFGEVAPTVVIWRIEHAEDEALDEPACPDPEAEQAQATKQGEAKAGEAEASEAKAGEAEASEAEASEAKAGDAKATDAEANDAAPNEAEAAETPPNDAEPTEATPTEAEPTEASPNEADPKPTDPESAEATSPDPEPKPAEPKPAEPKPAEQNPDAQGEDRPPLPAELFAADEQLSILQWQRRGYADGLDDDPGCAERVVYLPGSDRACSPPARRRRRRAASSCSSCSLPDGRPLAPAAPLHIELPRGLAGMIPLALWKRDDRLPTERAAAFDQTDALDYSLDDRGARLLAVLRTWSLLRRFQPHPRVDPRAALLPALCTAAEDPSPLALRDAVETLLASFADGNAALIVATGKAARRFVPPISLAWIEQRVVVAFSADEQAQPGDVITAIDGVSIDTLLAEQLLRTPAATASAAIVRTVARLLERERDGAAIELSLTRTTDDAGERESTVRVLADHRLDRRPLPTDARPHKPIVELDDGIVYVDATRMPRLAGAARRLRRATLAILDLRGELADPHGSLLAHFVAEPRVIAIEWMPTGPDPTGQLPLEVAHERRVEPDQPRLTARVVILADARTRGRAELELAGFDQLGATVIGSASAGDFGGVATAWLPGGWQLRFTHSELRGPDGSQLHGLGVRPTIPIEATRASLRDGVDPLVAAALELGPGSR